MPTNKLISPAEAVQYIQSGMTVATEGFVGIGFPEDLDPRNSPSLGLTIVNSLVQQLNGAIELDRRGGTTFTITFG